MGIGIGKNAPKLAFLGDKWNNKGRYSLTNMQGYYFGQDPSIIRTYVMNNLTGQDGNLLKIMWLLLNTDENFGLSQKWILENTGLEKNKYYDARQRLINMNWLVYKEEECKLYINYQFLWEQALLPKEQQINVQAYKKR